MNQNRLAVTLTLMAALAIGVSGCAGPGDQSSTSSTDGATAPAESTSPASPTDEAVNAEDDAAQTATAGSYVDFTDDIVASTVGTKVLFFHASWCPKCRALEKEITAGPNPAGLTIIKVDYDNSTALRQRYGVTLQTTIVYVDDDGSELSKKVLTDDPSLDALVNAAP